MKTIYLILMVVILAGMAHAQTGAGADSSATRPNSTLPQTPADSARPRPRNRIKFRVYFGPTLMNRVYVAPKNYYDESDYELAKSTPFSFVAGFQARRDFGKRGGFTLSEDVSLLHSTVRSKYNGLEIVSFENGIATYKPHTYYGQKNYRKFTQIAILGGGYYRPWVAWPGLSLEVRAGGALMEGYDQSFQTRIMPVLDLGARWEFTRWLALQAGFRSYLGQKMDRSYYDSRSDLPKYGFSFFYLGVEL
jgi:hypothetical protein